MKAIVCEMCNSNDFVKEDGMFVCQHCGTKYTVEEAKRMMIDGTVDVQGTVKVDNSSFVEKYLANARRAKQKEDWKDSEKYYNLVEQNDPANIEAIFYSSFARVKLALLEAETKDKRKSAFNPMIKGVSVIDDNYDASNPEHYKLLFQILDDIIGLYYSNIVPTTHLQNYVTKNGYGNVVDRSQVVENDSLDVTYDMIDKVAEAYIESITNIKENLSPVVFQLLKALANLAARNYSTSAEDVAFAAKYSINENDKADVDRLIGTTASVHVRTLIVNAAAFANSAAVKFLVEAGADVNFKAVGNKTALWHVAASPFANEADKIEARKCAKVLLDAGADPNVTDSKGVAVYNKKTDPEIAAMIKAKYPAIQQGKSSGCYVATAVYGSYDCPEVWTLRRFRDDTLASTWYGRAFIKTYYAVSPTLVKWFGDTEWFKSMWKPTLDKMVAKLNNNGVEDTPYNDKQW